MSRAYKFAKIQPQPGVNPSPDNTPYNTPYWTATDKVRFYNGFLRKLGGWQQAQPEGATISGVCRRIFSYFYNGKIRYLIGTHSKLYEYVDGQITNITPLQTTATTTLGANPLSVTNGSPTMTVTYTSHGLAAGDRIKFLGATNVGGITAATYINIEHIIVTVPNANSFTVTLGANASSTASGGGAAVDIYEEIADGYIDYEAGFGYGGGKYGVGKYGVGKTFISVFKVPRIWSFDRFGDNVVMTPGNGGKVYLYQNNNATAPAVLTNSPSASNFVFVENNAVCSVYNNVFSASDLGDATVWTAGPTNLAFSDTIEGAEEFWTAVNVRDGVLLLSVNQTWLARYVEGLGWSFKLLDTSAGLLSPLAAVSVNGVAYWAGLYDFYTYDGGAPEPVPNTIKQYVINTQSLSQYYKSFARLNRAFNEIWLHYPSDDEPDMYVIYNLVEKHFTYGTMDRTAAEGPLQNGFFPLLIDSSNRLWLHENGYNDGASAMSCYAETNYFQLGNGDATMRVGRIIPDSTQVGDVDMTIYTKLHQQASDERTFGPSAISATTEKVDVRAHGRLVKYRFAQDALDETFIMGGWYQGIQESTLR